MIKRNFTVSEDGQIVDDRPDPGPTRGQKKRNARVISDLGQILTELAKPELQNLPLEEELVEAVLLCTTMKRTARARQLRRIAKLLRDADREPLIRALQGAGRLP